MSIIRSQAFLPLLLALVCVPPAGAQRSAPYRSAAHPYEVPPVRSDSLYDSRVRLSGSDLALAATNGDTAWYSAGVNRVLCSLALGDQTWLGTAFGAKRLDAKTHTTQHFTTLDGLPYPMITALGSDGETLFCASVRKRAYAKSGVGQRGYQEWRTRPDDAVALCGFNAKTGRWNVMTEVKSEEAPTPNAGLDPSAESETEFVPHQWITLNAASVCLVPGPCIPGKTVALLVPLKSSLLESALSASAPARPSPANEMTERIVAPEFVKQPLVITTAQMDAQSLWLGTRQGLLRYDLQTRRWETLLKDAAVFGGVRAADGSLWILTRTSGPNEKDLERGTSRLVHWQAVHLTPGQPPTAYLTNSYLIKERRESPNEWTQAWLENITLANNKVWVTVNQRLAWGHGQMAYPPQVFSLDPRTRIVKVEASFPGNSSDAYLRLPLTVLANSHTQWGSLTPLVMPSRFPGWECAANPQEAALLEPPRNEAETQDAEGRRWAFGVVGGGKRNGSFLQRYNANGWNTEVDEDFHAPPPATFTVHDGATSPVTVGDTIYYLGGTNATRLYAWDRKTNSAVSVAWAEAALKQHRGDWHSGYKMLAGKDCVWISAENDVLRCDLNARRVDVWAGDTREPQSFVPRYALVGVEDDMAWVKGAPNRLYTVSAAHPKDFVPVVIPAFPGDLQRIRDKMILFGVEDNIAWFVGQTFVTPNDRPLVGYDLRTQTWTKSASASLQWVSGGETQPIRRQGQTCWFSTHSKEMSAIGYDAAQGRWTTLPPLTAQTIYAVQLAAVDAQNAWLTDTLTLYHLDRASGKWDAQKLPFLLSGFESDGSARLGDSLYLANGTGVWAYDTVTKQFMQSPLVTVASEEMYYRVMSVDAKALWLTVSRADTFFVCRFNRATGAWRYWGREDGVPSEDGELTGDGRSCWLRAGGLLYHLDPETDRWDNISRRLAAGRNDGKENGRDGNRVVPIQQVLVDGADVWLVSGTSAQMYRLPAPLLPDTVVVAASPLYRYHADTRQITAVDPAPGQTLTPATLTASTQSLLLAAPQGVYRLDRASGKWQAVILPPSPAGWPASNPYAAREVADKNGATVWVLRAEEDEHGISDAVRFRLPH